MLCSACQSLLAPGNIIVRESKILSHNPWFIHHKNGRELKLAAQSGCSICLHMWNGLSEKQRSTLWVEIDPNDTVAPPTITGQIQSALKDSCYRFDFRCGTIKWHFSTAPISNFNDDEAGEGQNTSWKSGSTAAEPVLAQAEQWLQQCCSNHTCGREDQFESSSTQWYPTRLIDVGTSTAKCLRLVHSSAISECTPYMTLSHCWGTIPIFRLLENNLASLQSDIPWEKIHLTFQNSITVTRRLGVRYLWIDSLCIIQDSNIDWLHEAALMGKVYKYSYCTIAATGFPSGEYGFFTERDPQIIQPIEFKFTSKVQQEKTATSKQNRFQKAKFKWHHVEEQQVVDVDMWTKNVGNAPLNTRGWVVQERVLSPRILHFSTTQIFWECRKLEACETYPHGIPDIARESRFKKSLPMYDLSTITENQYSTGSPREASHPHIQSHTHTPAIPLSPIPVLYPSTPLSSDTSDISNITFPTALPYTLDILVGQPSGSPFHIWDTVLKTYTASKLTHGSDKLVAISGIARELAPRMDCQYIAGLWEKQLARQLLWVSRPAKHPKKKNDGSSGKPYYAPSWSWASTDEPLITAIQWDWRGNKNQRDFLIDVLGIDIEQHDGNDNFGQVKMARLKLVGRMIGVQIVQEPSGLDSQHTTTVGSDMAIKAVTYRLVLDGTMLSNVAFHEDQAIENTCRRVFCVPISVSYSLSEFSLDSRILVHGLVMEDTELVGCFRRIGVFDTPYGTEFLAQRGEDTEQNRKNAKEFDWAECKQWHGKGGKLFGDCIFSLL